MPQTKRKPTCVKGTACGYACISGKKQCSERIKARDAAELLRQTGVTGAKQGAAGIPPYKVKQKIGEGSFGRADLTDRDTIVKTAFEYMAITPDMVKREFEAVKLMHSLGIGPEAKSLDADKLSFEMSFVKGKTFSEIDLTDGDRMAAAVAVLKLHKAGYVHNDLHDGNVIKSDDGSIKLIDGGQVMKAGDIDGHHGWFDTVSLLSGHPVQQKLLSELAQPEAEYKSEIMAAQKMPFGDARDKRRSDAKLKYHQEYLKVADKYIK